MRKFYMLALMAGSLEAGVCDATAPMKISLVGANRTAVVYKKANASSVSISTGNIADSNKR
ncbi:hypothetical protein L3C95_08845 [Chitinophaga filiformis]|uniref:hypothetical protein n=1 Tax=Chitinophaga filiformis TaxID=104663 RepID=UPI001F1A2908|nr:hypothetical protein [Chitinophaga filiformis]MCF6402977.1 hypothetical protein [Chitinophaga filiformis]